MDPTKPAAAPPAGFNTGEKSGLDHQPPPYQDSQGYPTTQPGYPPAQPYGAPGQPYGAPGQPYGAPGQPYGAPGQPYQGPYQGSYGQPVVTVQPAVYVTAVPLTDPLPDYLGYSIFTMLCCCLPLGIAALIYSINTRDANMTGNRPQAERSSRLARILNNTALGIGLTLLIIYIILIFVSRH